MDSLQKLSSSPVVENENFDENTFIAEIEENVNEIQKECNDLDFLDVHYLTSEMLDEESNLSSSDLSENSIKEIQEKYGIIFSNTNDSLVICCRFCFQRFTEFDKFITHVSNYHQHDKDTNSNEDFNSNEGDKSNIMSLEPTIEVNISNNEISNLKYYNFDEANCIPNVAESNISDTEFQQIEEIYLIQSDAPNITNFDQNPLKFPIVKQVRIENNIIKQFPCDYCGRPFKTKDQKLEHENIHTGNTPYKCRYFCGESFRARKMRWNHEKFQCKLSDDSRLNKNDDIENNENIKTEGNDGNNDCSNNEIFTCRFCSRTFGKKNNLRDHELTHTNERPYKCPHCNESFRDRKSRWRHKKIHENEIKTNNTDQLAKETEILNDVEFGDDNDDDNDADDERKQNQDAKYNCKFECTYCNKIFKDKRNKFEHELIHTGGTPYNCRFCKKSFRSRKIRWSHEQTHKTPLTEAINANKQDLIETVDCKIPTKNKPVTDKTKNDEEEGAMLSEIDSTIQDKSLTCTYCNKVFKDKWNKLEHKVIHTGQTPYNCRFCEKSFRYRKSRWSHEQFHKTSSIHAMNENEKKPIEIVDCKIPRKNKPVTDKTKNDEEEGAMLSEIDSTIQYKPLTCTYCNKVFKDKWNKLEHEVIHTGETPYNCRFCEKSFRYRKTRWSHEQFHKTSSIHAMNENEKKLIEIVDNKIPLKDEAVTDDTENDEEGENMLNEKGSTIQGKLFACTYCNKIFKDKRNKLEHEVIHTGETPYNCRFCEKSFRNRKTRWSHEQIHKISSTQVMNENEENPLEIYICKTCHRTFSDKTDLTEHIKDHTDEKNFPCRYCEIIFVRNHERNKHEHRYHGCKPFLCQTCGKTFNRKTKLNSHSLRHTGMKLFECDVCHKRFYSKCDLATHKVSHTDEKPFSCEICGSRFARKKALKCHSEIHSETANHVCQACGKAFKRGHTYRYHIRKHSSCTLLIDSTENSNKKKGKPVETTTSTTVSLNLSMM